MFYLCYRHASFFAFIISKKISATYAFHMCVGYYKTKQTPSNKIWYDIYIYDRHYIRTHVYVFLFSMCFNYREFDLKRDPLGGAPYVVFIGPIFHNTIEACLKRVGHCGYEWVEKKCVGLQRTWVCKRTVYLIKLHVELYFYVSLY